MEDEWDYQEHDILLRTHDNTIWHVTGRFEDVDSGVRYYHLWDATHTTDCWYHSDDVEGLTEDSDGTHEFLCELPDEFAKPIQLDVVRRIHRNEYEPEVITAGEDRDVELAFRDERIDETEHVSMPDEDDEEST